MAAPVFFGALAGLVLLFVLRVVEERRGGRFAARFRRRLDWYARVLKALVWYAADMLERFPLVTGYAARGLAATVVRRFAHATESVSQAAHTAADMVSYKHRYERMETRSAFLKKVSGTREGSSQETDSK
jgi:hypothetical protein